MNHNYFSTLQKLLPPVSYDRNGSELQVILTAEGNALNNVQKHATKVLNAVTPFYAGDLINDWERVLGIPSDNTKIYQARLEHVLEKLMEMGGLSIPYFTNIATKMGYTITITEGASELFRAGINRVGDSIGSSIDLMWVWRVHIESKHQEKHYFRAGISRAHERLSVYSDPVIESVFNDLKPAFTHASFFYLVSEESK